MRAALCAALLILAGCAAPTEAPRESPRHTIQEDEPGWDCHTDGNRICGPLA